MTTEFKSESYYRLLEANGIYLTFNPRFWPALQIRNTCVVQFTGLVHLKRILQIFLLDISNESLKASLTP